MKKLCCLLAFVFIQACNVDKSKKVDFAKLDFDTQEATEMYFRNVRQSAYFIEDNQEARLVLYRNKRWLKSGSAAFTPVIIHNWRQDKAYMLIEWREDGRIESAMELLIRRQDTTTDRVYYRQGNMKEQLGFLTAVYNGIIGDAAIFEVRGGEEIPFFSTEVERQTFRVILFDYYRLVGVF